MTGPASGGYDPCVLSHPEYARSYHRYLQQGAPPEDAARRAYQESEQHIATVMDAPRPARKVDHVVIGIAFAILGVFGVGWIGADVAVDDGPDKAALRTAARPFPADVAASPAADPASSPATEPPPAAPPAAASTPAAPPPATAAPPAATTAQPPAPPLAPSQPAASAAEPGRATIAGLPRGCDPAYPDVCLRAGIGDYDCEGGSGNGPNYVRGPIRVLAPDPFGLDRDHDGTGCES
jgi:hypothetical protein